MTIYEMYKSEVCVFIVFEYLWLVTIGSFHFILYMSMYKGSLALKGGAPYTPFSILY